MDYYSFTHTYIQKVYTESTYIHFIPPTYKLEYLQADHTQYYHTYHKKQPLYMVVSTVAL